MHVLPFEKAATVRTTEQQEFIALEQFVTRTHQEMR